MVGVGVSCVLTLLLIVLFMSGSLLLSHNRTTITP